jgi:hypothetical protein
MMVQRFFLLHETWRKDSLSIMKSGVEIHSAQLHAMCDGAKIRSRADIPTQCSSLNKK